MTFTLPNWIAQWSGLETGPGEAIVISFSRGWPWPSWATLLALIFAAGIILQIYLRQGRQAGRRYRIMLAAIRFSLVAIMLLMIAQLTLSFKRTCLPDIVILVDDSKSMTIVDQYDDDTRRAIAQQIKKLTPNDVQPSRWDLARALLSQKNAALLRGLTNQYKMQLYYLTGLRSSRGPDLQGIVEELNSSKPSGETSPLGAAICHILDNSRGVEPAAIIIFSDGINTQNPSLADAAAYAQRREVPLYCIGLGSTKPAQDLKLSDLLVDDVVFVDDVVVFECKLTGTGLQGIKATVTLREKSSSNVLAKADVTVWPDDQSQTIRLIYRPTQPGEYHYTVEAQPQQGELQTDNNRQSRTVQVRKQTMRVLLAQARPSFEFRYLCNVLKRDESVELHTLLQDADLEHAEQDKAALRMFPERREDLFSYDVIILGDLDPSLLSESTMRSLAAFVDQPGKGGALVLIAGPLYMPLAYRDTAIGRLFPIELNSVRLPDPNKPITEGFVLRPSELGLASPAMQLGDSPSETESIWKNLPPLFWRAEAQDLKPGAIVLAEHPTEITRDGRPLPIFIMQYVGSGKVLFHATDETWRWRWRVGDTYFARYWIQTIRYLCRSKLNQGGNAATLTTEFTVAPPPGEFAQINMDEKALSEAANQTGGRYYDFQTAGNLLRELPPTHQLLVETLPPIPLWNKWPVLLVFFILLITEWLLRKRGGMV